MRVCGPALSCLLISRASLSPALVPRQLLVCPQDAPLPFHSTTRAQSSPHNTIEMARRSRGQRRRHVARKQKEGAQQNATTIKPSVNPLHSRLMSLPAELRNRIWAAVFEGWTQKIGHFVWNTKLSDAERAYCRQPPLLRVVRVLDADPDTDVHADHPRDVLSASRFMPKLLASTTQQQFSSSTGFSVGCAAPDSPAGCSRLGQSERTWSEMCASTCARIITMWSTLISQAIG